LVGQDTQGPAGLAADSPEIYGFRRWASVAKDPFP
jgi:hypothetical protein